jgi:hypothetical protein
MPPSSINSFFNPVWNWDGAYVAALANKIGDDPVLLSLLDIFNSQRRQFSAPQAASQENGERSVISLASKTASVYRPKKVLPCSAESQLPTGIPSRLAPFTRRKPAARSALRSPQRLPRTPVFALPRAAN